MAGRNPGGSEIAVLQIFIFREGRFWGTECFSQGKVVMGRSPDVDLELDDDLCSRNHAAITQTPEGLILEDLGSSNGTFVNGEQVTRCYVTSKDEVILGSFQLKFKLLARKRPRPQAQSTRMVAREDLAAPPVADVDDTTGRQGALPSLDTGEPEEPETQVTAQVIRGPGAPAPAAEEEWAQPPETERVPSLGARERPAAGPPPAGDRVATEVSGEPAPPPAQTEAPGFHWVEPPPEEAAAPAPEPEPYRPARAPAPEPEPHRPEPARGRPFQGSGPSSRIIVADQPAPADAFGGALAEQPQAAFEPAVPLEDMDEDEEEDFEVQHFVEPFSLLHNLVSENFAQSKTPTEPHLHLEVIGYNQDKKVQEYIEVGVGKSYRVAGEKAALVRCTGEGSCRVRITPEMTGGVIVDGRTVSIEQYRTPENLDPKATGASIYNCTLRKGDYANLMTPEGCWFMRFVYPPRLPPVPKMRPDPSLLKSLGSSAVLHVVGLITLGVIAALNAEATTEEPTDRFAQIDLKDLEIEKPEEEPEVPLDELPPPEKKEEEKKPEEKKPEEAPKPTKVEKPKPSKKAGKGAPSPDPGPGAGIMAALGNLSQKKPTTNIVAAVTNIDAVRSKGGNYKVSGLVTKLPTSNVVFSNGQGVGVKAGIELLRGGKGGGAAGIGPGALTGGPTGKRKVGGVVFKAPTRSMKVRGSLSKEAIAAVVKKHLSEIQYCYEKNLLLNPNLSGKVIMEWTIALNGSVSLVKTAQNTMTTPAVAMCISAKIKAWKFPEPKGGSVVVTYPFMFNTVGF